ncbi:T9SS C-terminal target domain-containing protein [Aquimarina sp. BL5]|uniref:starch-binding protein n=1 Tax=Aquimarina sp. BL5 TaxID=1714860 RepID=UPI000E512616|nr:starch-binding protein [Aquimarina sp. BL5]AXT51014.1 T9SS C-terminal target domain-containing protein [Aquimarina sp. BL5]RKN06568.1 starch-binding protein [Aquimarina sp. BL5]
MKKTIPFLKVSFMLLFIFLNFTPSNGQYNLDAPWMSEISLKEKSNKASVPKFDEVVNAFNNYWKEKDDTVKGSGHKPFMRWQEFYKNAVMPDGTLPTPDFYWNIWEQKRSKKAFGQKIANTWSPMGPFDHYPSNSWSPGQGRVNVAILDPNQSNVMYVGAPAGGIWKSIDSGQHWEPLSDYLPQIGVSGIAIDHNNSNIIYISTGDDDASDALGIGVLKSIDGGITWNKTGLDAADRYEIGNDIYIDPNNSNKLWVATSRGVYKTEDAGVTWIKTLSGNIKDIKIKPGDTNVIYAATSNTFYKSTNSGNSFFVVRNGLPVSSSRLVIDVTPANPEYVYLLSSDSQRSFQGLYKSMDSGSSFTKTQETINIFESTQSWYDLALAVSDQDPNVVFVGCLNVWKSVNGGDDFTKINNWSSPTQVTYTHADIHFLRYYDGRLFCGSDGGVYESQDNGGSFSDLTKGLQIGQFYKISVAENSSVDYLVGGLQDNGGYALDGLQWNVYHGADGMDCAVKGNNPDTYFGFIQYGRNLYRTEDRGKTRTFAASGPDRGNWVTPLVSDRNGNLYAGFKSFYKLENSSFKNQTEFDFGGNNIEHIELDPSDVNIMYLANDLSLYRSMDAGVTWSKIYSFPTLITSIEVHNDDNQIIYVSTSGSVSGKVFRSNNQGNDFVDISGNLPEEGKFVVRHHKGTESIYLGTYLGVYFKDGDRDWEDYSVNLPNVAVRDLEINLKDNFLVAATYGRGVWKVPLEIEITPDDSVPSVPSSLMASDIDQTSVRLSWDPSSDNIAVTSYEVYQGEDFVKSVSTVTTVITGLSPNTNYDFKVVAKDRKGNQSIPSEIVSITTDVISEIEINFYKPSGWSDQMNVYFFSATSNSTLLGTIEWPGQQMSNYPSTNWYAYRLQLPPGVNADDVRIVFNVEGNQTDDLARGSTGWYYNGIWSDECPVDCDGLNLTAIDVYFKTPTYSWNGASNIYVFDNKQNVRLENTEAWPGQTMTTIVGSPWKKWSFVVPDGVSLDDVGIVFNDGNGMQTIDLERNRTGWFTVGYIDNGKYVGFWSDSCPSSCDQIPSNEELGTTLPNIESSSTKVKKAFIFPNPISGQSVLKFHSNNNGVLEVTAVNLLGQKKVIHSQKIESGVQSIMIDRNDVDSKGIYFYVISINGIKQENLKVVVQ